MGKLSASVSTQTCTAKAGSCFAIPFAMSQNFDNLQKQVFRALKPSWAPPLPTPLFFFMSFSSLLHLHFKSMSPRASHSTQHNRTSNSCRAVTIFQRQTIGKSSEYTLSMPQQYHPQQATPHCAPVTFCSTKLTAAVRTATLCFFHLLGRKSEPGTCCLQGYSAPLAGPPGDAGLWDLWGDEAAGKETQALKIGCLW